VAVAGRPVLGPILSAAGKWLSRKAFCRLPQHYPKGCPQNMGIKRRARAGPKLRASAKSLPFKGFLDLPDGYP
jgi:hypothetical protein